MLITSDIPLTLFERKQQNPTRILPVKYSLADENLGLSFLGDQVGRTRDIPPDPETKPKLTGNLDVILCERKERKLKVL